MFKNSRTLYLLKYVRYLSKPNNEVNFLILNFLRQQSFTSSVFRFIFNVLFSRITKGYLKSDIKRINNSCVKILSSKHVLFIAQLLQKQLIGMGITSTIHTETPKEGYDDGLYFVLCAQVFDSLPRNYIAFQLEQLPVIHHWWQDPSYKKKLEDAVAVVDYSISNLRFLIEKGFPRERLFHLPIFSKVCEKPQSEYKYDVLFYGYVNERRRKILSELKKDFKILVVDNCFGPKMCQLIKESKVILNIHNLDNGIVESARLFECLSMGKIIVSETGLDQEEYEYLGKDIISFVPVGDIESLRSNLSQILNGKEFNNKVQKLINTLNSYRDPFSFNLSRLFLALGLISLDNFAKYNSNNAPLINTSLTVSDEYVESHDYFPVLKYFLPWMSKEITIKYLTLLAKAQNLPYLEISFNNKMGNYDPFQDHPNKLLKKGEVVYIPSGHYDDIISWNEIQRMSNPQGNSILDLFTSVD